MSLDAEREGHDPQAHDWADDEIDLVPVEIDESAEAAAPQSAEPEAAPTAAPAAPQANGPVNFPYDAAGLRGDGLTYAILSQPQRGWVINNGDGTFFFDPVMDFRDLAPGDSQLVSFTYQVSDGQGGAESVTTTLSVTGRQDAPPIVALSDEALPAGQEGQSAAAPMTQARQDPVPDHDAGTTAAAPDDVDPPEVALPSNDPPAPVAPGGSEPPVAAPFDYALEVPGEPALDHFPEMSAGPSIELASTPVEEFSGGPAAEDFAAETGDASMDQAPMEQASSEPLAMDGPELTAEPSIEPGATPAEAFAGESATDTVTATMDEPATALESVPVEEISAEPLTADSLEPSFDAALAPAAEGPVEPDDSGSTVAAGPAAPDMTPEAAEFGFDGAVDEMALDAAWDSGEPDPPTRFEIADDNGEIPTVDFDEPLAARLPDGPEPDAGAPQGFEAVTAPEPAADAESALAAPGGDDAAAAQSLAYPTPGSNFAVVEQPADGKITDNGDGTFAFEPGGELSNLQVGEMDQVGFAYRVDDGEPVSAIMTVIGTSDGPFANAVTVAGGPAGGPRAGAVPPAEPAAVELGPDPVMESVEAFEDPLPEPVDPMATGLGGESDHPDALPAMCVPDDEPAMVGDAEDALEPGDDWPAAAPAEAAELQDATTSAVADLAAETGADMPDSIPAFLTADPESESIGDEAGPSGGEALVGGDPLGGQEPLDADLLAADAVPAATELGDDNPFLGSDLPAMPSAPDLEMPESDGVEAFADDPLQESETAQDEPAQDEPAQDEPAMSAELPDMGDLAGEPIEAAPPLEDALAASAPEAPEPATRAQADAGAEQEIDLATAYLMSQGAAPEDLGGDDWQSSDSDGSETDGSDAAIDAFDDLPGMDDLSSGLDHAAGRDIAESSAENAPLGSDGGAPAMTGKAAFEPVSGSNGAFAAAQEDHGDPLAGITGEGVLRNVIGMDNPNAEMSPEGERLDVLYLDGVGGGPDLGDWQLELSAGEVVETLNGRLVLSDGAAGTIVLSDGAGQIHFAGVQRIVW